MDIRALNLFLHLADTLHFGRTSRACNITRSGLTRTIQRLEQELGEQLFFRNNRSVRLTETGRLFLQYASDTVRSYRILQNRIASENRLRGELSIYCSVTAILSILPEIIGEFRQQYPDVHLKLSTGDAAMALARLENGEADVTIAALPEHLPSHIRFLKLLQTPLIFIGPRSRKSDAPRVIDELLQKEVIMPERGLSRVRCERWFAEKQISPQIYSYVAGNEAMIAMVALGCGIGVVPRLVLDNSPLKNQVAVFDVTPELEPFEVGICTTKSAIANPTIEPFWHITELKSIQNFGETHAHHSDYQ
ncbi:MAG: HTH-type transcriptional activator IlvY [Desulfofustis sp.]|nr:HTH-type transcriptional activator IlvY [Desulfofustis sp.]